MNAATMISRRRRAESSAQEGEGTRWGRVAIPSRRRAGRLLVAVLALGCAPVELGVRATDEHGRKHRVLPQVAREACDLWGLECFSAHGLRTPAIDLEILPRHLGVPDHVEGRTEDSWRWCTNVSWAEDDDVIVAHELGHMFGLEHQDASGNVMHIDDNGGREDLTDEQLATMHDRAYRFAWGCPAKDPS
jgi:hypothetical protein